MYNPARFQEPDRAVAIKLMKAYPLATLISVNEGRPWVSHLPLVVEQQDQELILYGHLARANLHWQWLAQTDVYVIFQGPNAYITPTWFAKNDVPTWSYATVHLQGKCELQESAEQIKICLMKLTQQMESQRNEPWEFWIPPDLEGRLEKAIVAFRITVQETNTKIKLSQSRSPEDQRRIIQALSSAPDDNSRAIAELMIKPASAID